MLSVFTSIFDWSSTYFTMEALFFFFYILGINSDRCCDYFHIGISYKHLWVPGIGFLGSRFNIHPDRSCGREVSYWHYPQAYTTTCNGRHRILVSSMCGWWWKIYSFALCQELEDPHAHFCFLKILIWTLSDNFVDITLNIYTYIVFADIDLCTLSTCPLITFRDSVVSIQF